MWLKSILQRLTHDATSGMLLFASLLLAMICCNSGLVNLYQSFWQLPMGVQMGGHSYTQPMIFWVNEGLMTLFFFVVGLELKREFLEGELASFKQVILPAAAALGGMLVPIVIYCAFNFSNPAALQGWAIPVATDIAFALGVLSLFGKKVPIELRLFLMTLAIFDDVGAILIIAIFNTGSLSYLSLLFASGCLVLLAALRARRVRRSAPYVLVGVLLWVGVLGSGVHATLAGILLSLMIPNNRSPQDISVLKKLEYHFKAWVDFLVLPLFAFANAGLVLGGITLSIFIHPIVLGVALGLFIGKQVGVIFMIGLFKHFKWLEFNKNTGWLAYIGVAILCGIGFTMSLFLGTLAFADNNASMLFDARLGVLLGSGLSGITGAAILWAALRETSAVRG